MAQHFREQVYVSDSGGRIVKTSESEQHGGKCPKCDGKITQDRKHLGFVRHLERFVPNDPSVPRNEQGLCRYGRGDRERCA